jgi:NAD(P)-dependent dehydrogenase (short-subunit alcohol dehydrogenase family)
MKNIAIFGGSGGLGTPLSNLFLQNNNFNTIQISSKDVNICSRQEVDLFFEKNKIDIIINLAAYNYDSFLHKYTIEKELELDKQLNVNIKGAINILTSGLPHMRKNKYGRIIFASSIVASRPVIGTSIYGASKNFIESLIKTCSLENANNNITANTIQLGYFDGGLLYKLNEESREKIKETIPSKRWGSIDELYSSIMYLINTPYVTGTTISINGGI